MKYIKKYESSEFYSTPKFKIGDEVVFINNNMLQYKYLYGIVKGDKVTITDCITSKMDGKILYKIYNPKKRETYIRRFLNNGMADQENARNMTDYLFSEDMFEYEWVIKYNL
jgi:hypothetical protein